MFNIILDPKNSSFNSGKIIKCYRNEPGEKYSQPLAQFLCSQVKFIFKKGWPGQLKYLKM